MDEKHSTPPPPKIEKRIEESVVYVGFWLGCWGHEITDHLRYFWVFFNQHYAHLKNLKWVYAPTTLCTKPNENFLSYLKSLHLPIENLMAVTQATEFKTIILPDECFWNENNFGFYTPEFLAILARLPPMPAPLFDVEKVYFSRLNFQSEKDFNEESLKNYFEKHGFHIVYPEKITFLQELAILQHCRIFAATDGSICHNLIFANPQTALILRKCRHSTGYQISINKMKTNTNIVYIDVGFSPFADYFKKEWNLGPFFVYESSFLRAYFGEKKGIFPFFKFVQFCFRQSKNKIRQWNWTYIDHTFLAWTHSWRAKLKLGSRLRKMFKNPR